MSARKTAAVLGGVLIGVGVLWVALRALGNALWVAFMGGAS